MNLENEVGSIKFSMNIKSYWAKILNLKHDYVHKNLVTVIQDIDHKINQI